MHPTIKLLHDVINDLIDDGEDTILIKTNQYGDWKIGIPLSTITDYERIQYFNEFCEKWPLWWIIVHDVPDLYVQLTPTKKEEA